MEQQVIRGLKQGNIVLTALQKETLLEEVEKLMADTAEAVAYQNVYTPVYRPPHCPGNICDACR